MSSKHSKREIIKSKYGGLCAYSGQSLREDWQIDHIVPVAYYQMGLVKGDPNCIDNLIPVQRILNHYKRCLDMKQWREYLSTLHLRLAKLPKNPCSAKGISRKAYLLEVAAHFQITPTQPFDGKFFMDQFNTSQ
jgi:hypothetical protein